jgi:DNA-binding beta-propeller fold protein YncE
MMEVNLMADFNANTVASLLLPASSRRRFLGTAAASLGAASMLSFSRQALAAPTINSFSAGNDSRGVAIATQLSDGSKRIVIANMGETFVTVRNSGDGSLVGNFQVGGGTFGAAYDPMTGHVWLTQTGQDRVLDFDPATGSYTSFGAGSIGLSCRGIVAGNGNIWVTNFNDALLTKLDATTGSVLNQFSIGTASSSAPFGTCLDDWGNVWVALMGENSIIRVNPQSGSIDKRVTVGAAPRAVTYDNGFVWASTSVGNTVAKIRARDGVLIAETSVGQNCRDLVVAGRYVYVDCPDGGLFQVWELDRASAAVTRQIQFPSIVYAHGIAFDGEDNLWVSSGGAVPPLCYKVTITSTSLL